MCMYPMGKVFTNISCHKQKCSLNKSFLRTLCFNKFFMSIWKSIHLGKHRNIVDIPVLFVYHLIAFRWNRVKKCNSFFSCVISSIIYPIAGILTTNHQFDLIHQRSIKQITSFVKIQETRPRTLVSIILFRVLTEFQSV